MGDAIFPERATSDPREHELGMFDFWGYCNFFGRVLHVQGKVQVCGTGRICEDGMIASCWTMRDGFKVQIPYDYEFLGDCNRFVSTRCFAFCPLSDHVSKREILQRRATSKKRRKFPKAKGECLKER
jgi:hypothetical protein